MSSNESSSEQGNLVNTGQPWIAEAIAQQEEHLRRIRPCTGGRYPNPRPGMEHAWTPFSPRPGVVIRQCWRCGVTETDEDYQRKTAAAGPSPD